MKKLKQYYFLPFLDYILAILVSLLFTMFFGSWFSAQWFGKLFGLIVTLVMCGFLYCRMWKFGRKSVRCHYDLPRNTGVRCLLPLATVSVIILLVYALAANGNLQYFTHPVKTYYTFADNAPRTQVSITRTDYITVFVRFWFAYFMGFSDKIHVIAYFIAPLLQLFFGGLGFHWGSQNKEILDDVVRVHNSVKKKFNE